MKALLYLAPANINLDKPDGVCKKIMQQTKVFSEHFDTSIVAYGESGKVVRVHDDRIAAEKKLTGRRHRRHQLYEYAWDVYQAIKPDYVYIRYGYSDERFVQLLKRMNQSGSRIIIEIPTYPYAQEAKVSLYRRLTYAVDCLYRGRLKKYVYKIATFSDDAQIFGISCVHIVNGVDMRATEVRKAKKCQDESIHLIAVSSMERWHGYDRIIEGMKQYEKLSKECALPKVIVDLVGKGAEYETYKENIRECGMENVVIMHGFKSGEELEELYGQADIALASLAMHRIGVYVASTLKTREYLAKGIPIVTSCKIDIIPDDFPYLLRVSEDDSVIDIKNIVDFYNQMQNRSSEANRIREIREFAEKKCDIYKVMEEIVELFLAK